MTTVGLERLGFTFQISLEVFGDWILFLKRLKMPNTMLNGWDLRATHYEAGTAEEIIPRWYQEGYPG